MLWTPLSTCTPLPCTTLAKPESMLFRRLLITVCVHRSWKCRLKPLTLPSSTSVLTANATFSYKCTMPACWLLHGTVNLSFISSVGCICLLLLCVLYIYMLYVYCIPTLPLYICCINTHMYVQLHYVCILLCTYVCVTFVCVVLLCVCCLVMCVVYVLFYNMLLCAYLHVIIISPLTSG